MCSTNPVPAYHFWTQYIFTFLRQTSGLMSWPCLCKHSRSIGMPFRWNSMTAYAILFLWLVSLFLLLFPPLSDSIDIISDSFLTASWSVLLETLCAFTELVTAGANFCQVTFLASTCVGQLFWYNVTTASIHCWRLVTVIIIG